MKIYLKNTSVICNAGAGESILLACARSGVMLSAPCGGQRRCGKCRVQLLEGQVTGDMPDSEGFVRACAAIPASDITIFFFSGSELIGNEVMISGVENKPPLNRAGIDTAAVALDIGTTTVSARLVNPETFEVLDTVSELNDQRVFGADVMSRIGAAKNGRTAELFNVINRQTEKIIMYFKERWNISRIEKLAVSGNTVMLHLFLNVDPSGMGEVPFTPVFLEEKEIDGAQLQLSAEKIIILPSIASFIGSDITSGLAVLDILSITGPSLFVDIGTNGEMALAHNGNIFCCSTAAGPAFEGAEISCGAGGIKGAISAVEFQGYDSDNKFTVTTIGNVPPVGICGSGLIDAAALMLKLKIIDETGFMENSEKGFFVAPGISVSAKDIRQFQLAKSAILSGIRILCKRAGLNTADVKKVFIAGGFGFFINKHNAAAAGIFPNEFVNSMSVCGNLSLQGAEELLANNNFMEKCREIIKKCTVIDLSAEPSFMEEFAQNMLFSEEHI